MTGKTRQQRRPAVQLPDRANNSLALCTQAVPHFSPFPPSPTVFRSCLDTAMLHAAIVISPICSVLLCWLGLRRYCSLVLPLFGAGGYMVAPNSEYIKMNA